MVYPMRQRFKLVNTLRLNKPVRISIKDAEYREIDISLNGVMDDSSYRLNFDLDSSGVTRALIWGGEVYSYIGVLPN